MNGLLGATLLVADCHVLAVGTETTPDSSMVTLWAAAHARGVFVGRFLRFFCFCLFFGCLVCFPDIFDSVIPFSTVLAWDADWAHILTVVASLHHQACVGATMETEVSDPLTAPAVVTDTTVHVRYGAQVRQERDREIPLRYGHETDYDIPPWHRA